MSLRRLAICVGGAVVILCFVFASCMAIMLDKGESITPFYVLMSIGIVLLGGGLWWTGFEEGKRIYGKP